MGSKHISPIGAASVPLDTVSAVALEAHYRKLWNDELLLAEALSSDRAMLNKGLHGISAMKHAGMPLLNATQKDMERSLLDGLADKHPQHALNKLERSIRVKPLTAQAAKEMKGWHTREWKIYSLRYAKQFCLLNEKGIHSVRTWPSMKALFQSLSEYGLEVFR